MSNQAYVPYSVLLRQHEEAQKLKEVLDRKVTGTVKWFSLRYHYGFIERDDGKGDVFVHQMNIAKSRMKRVYLRSLAHNEKVEFDVVQGKVGPEASNVTGPDGADVQGVYVIQLRYPIRPPMSRGNNLRRRTTSGSNNRRQRRRTENEDDNSAPASQRRNRRRTENTSDDGNSSSPQKGQGQRRNNRTRRNRSRTISATNPNALEKKVADAIDDVGGVKVVKPNAAASGDNKDVDNNTNAGNNKAANTKADDNNKTSDNKTSENKDLDKKVNDLIDDIGAVRVSN